MLVEIGQAGAGVWLAGITTVVLPSIGVEVESPSIGVEVEGVGLLLSLGVASYQTATENQVHFSHVDTSNHSVSLTQAIFPAFSILSSLPRYKREPRSMANEGKFKHSPNAHL